MSAIDDKYNQLGGPASFLGNPVGNEQKSSDLVGSFRVYKGGRIYFSPASDAHVVRGLILMKYLALGAERSFLGYPKTDEEGVGGAADTARRFNHFQNGSIYWSGATGAHEIHGAIRAKWLSLPPAQRDAFGLPKTCERIVSDGEGRYNDFEHGSIYWKKETGAHTILGAIESKWQTTGGATGPLGYPTTDETGLPNPGDTGKRFNLFEHGSIYWRNGFGAYYVLREIDQQWAAQGREKGPLGFPLSDELAAARGSSRFNLFEHGSLERTPVKSPLLPISLAPPPFVFKGDLSFNGILAEHDTQKSNGFRLLSLGMWGPASDPRYAAVWAKSGPEQKVIFKATPNEYQQFLGTQIDAGFRPSIIAATGTASDAVFALVCEKDSGPVPVIRRQLTAGPTNGIYDRETFAYWCAWARANNHILRSAAIYGDAADPRYAGIWELDRSEVSWNVAYHDAQFKLPLNFFAEGTPQLLGKDDLPAVMQAQTFWARPAFRTHGAGGRHLVLFRDDRAGKFATREDLTAAQVKSEAAALGAIPVCVQGSQANGSEPRYNVLFSEHVRPQKRKLTVNGPSAGSMAAFDDAVGNLLRRGEGRHASLAIARDGRLVYARAFTWGEPDQIPIKPANTFRIASLTKSITAVAVYQLIRDNLLPASALDEPLVKHLQITLPSNADPRFSQMTIRQLLTHRSGLLRNNANSIDSADQVLAFFEGKKKLPLSMADVATYLASKPLVFDPGAKTEYSNVAFMYLSWLVEQKRGSYTAAVRKHIFDPIGIPQNRPKITGSLTTDQGPLEVIAYDRELRVGRSVMSESRPISPLEYGTLNFNVSQGSGSWSLASADYVRFLARLFDGSNTLLHADFLASLTEEERRELREHGGGLIGAETFGKLFDHQGSRMAFAIFYNRDVPGNFVNHVADIITALPATVWPGASFDLFSDSTVGIQ